MDREKREREYWERDIVRDTDIERRKPETRQGEAKSANQRTWHEGKQKVSQEISRIEIFQLKFNLAGNNFHPEINVIKTFSFRNVDNNIFPQKIKNTLKRVPIGWMYTFYHKSKLLMS